MTLAVIIAWPLALFGFAVYLSRRQHRETRRRLGDIEAVAIEGRDEASGAKATSHLTRAELNRLVETAKKMGPKAKI